MQMMERMQGRNNDDKHLLLACKGAEKHLEVCKKNLKHSLRELWHVVGDKNMPLPVISQTAAASGSAEKVLGEDAALRAELEKKMMAHANEYAKMKKEDLIPRADDRYAGNCFSASYKGSVKDEKDEIVEYRCFTVFALGGKKAYSMVHVHHHEDKDNFLFHWWDGNKHHFAKDVVPDAVLIQSDGTVKQAFHSRPQSKGDVLDHVSSPAVVSMLYYKALAKDTASSVSQFMSLQCHRFNSLIWVYSIATSRGTDFMICRKKDFDDHQRIVAAIKHAVAQKKNEDVAGADEDQLHKREHYAHHASSWLSTKKGPGMRETFPGEEKESTGKKNRIAVSSANKIATKKVGPAWHAYKTAMEIYANKEFGLDEKHAILIEEQARSYVEYADIEEGRKERTLSPKQISALHRYEQAREIKPAAIAPAGGVRLHWTYHVRTKSMPHNQFAIEFGVEDDFSHEQLQSSFAYRVAYNALHHCLAHRVHGMRKFKKADEMWDVHAIHRAIEAVEKDAEYAANESGGVVFREGNCTVFVSRRNIDVNQYTCSSSGQINEELKREETVALAVRNICMDRPYEVSVNFGDVGEGLHGYGFSVVVHLAMAQMPYCREDAVTTLKLKGKDTKPEQVQKNEKEFVHVSSLDRQRHFRFGGAVHPRHHHGIGAQQVIRRVAEMHADTMMKRHGQNAASAVASWCNAQIAHVHQGNRYVWAEVTTAWSVQEGSEMKEFSLQTKYSLTIASIGRSHKAGSKARAQAQKIREEHEKKGDKTHALYQKNVSVAGHRGAPKVDDHADAQRVTQHASVARLQVYEETKNGGDKSMHRGSDIDFGGLKIERAIGAASRIF